MTKKVIGFNEESDFERMAKSVRKSENMPAVGSQQRRLYPGGGGGGGIECRFEVVSVTTDSAPYYVVASVEATDTNRSSVPGQDENDEITIYDKAGCYINTPYASLVGKEGYARYMKNLGGNDGEWEMTALCQP